jgi:ribosomal protein L11 methyltransferase
VIRLGIRVRAADAEIAFARLEPVLAAGAEEIAVDGGVEFVVYGDSLPSEADLRSIAGETILEVNRSPVDAGWARAWQDHLAPVTVGAFTIRPPWLDGDPSDLVIDPGPSFGAASHPTTRLCLELLQDCARGLTPPAPAAEADSLRAHGPPPRAGLADWGAGSGVLAIAAARLGFAPVIAVELDPAAAHTARRNAARNATDVDVVVGDATRNPTWAPTIVANLTLPLLEAAAVAAVSAPPVRLIASGVLASRADVAVAAWTPLGFVERERRELDGWAALVLERA